MQSKRLSGLIFIMLLIELGVISECSFLCYVADMCADVSAVGEEFTSIEHAFLKIGEMYAIILMEILLVDHY